MLLHSEFRDGNVPAGHQVTCVMVEAVSSLPDGVKQVYTRQDTAAYQTDFLLHAIVTNQREEDAIDLIHWHCAGCGKSEEAHAILKEDFAGGHLSSAKFGANAAWWAIVVLSVNVHI